MAEGATLMKSILDVGCGSRPWGTCNIDLNHGVSKHHRFRYSVKDISNFTLGSGSDLPYKDNSFDVVVSRHSLEHIPEPLKAVKEWKRVARKAVIIMIPNNPTLEEYGSHLYSWSLVSFESFLRLVFDDVKVFANSPLHDLMMWNFTRKLIRKGWLKKPLQRFISRWLGLQLTAICYCEKEAPRPKPLMRYEVEIGVQMDHQLIQSPIEV